MKLLSEPDPQARPSNPPELPAFVDRVYAQYLWYRHATLLAETLARVANGEIKRLIVTMPPRHGKSLLISRLFPAYWLALHPDQFVGLCSYTAEIAYAFSRSARDFHRQAGGAVRADAATMRHWETGQGGGMWATGVGGPITGKGFNLGIIDDPLKNAADAESPVVRKRQQDWYQSTFLTRAEPDAAIIIVQTRWHEDDLTGFVLAEETNGDEPEGWTILHLPAIAEEAPPSVPETCTLLTDWRAPGEPLCPERYPLAKLERLRSRLGPYFWAALFQGGPTAAGGNLFQREWFKTILEATPNDIVARCRYWDLAASTDGDYTCGVLLAWRADGSFLIEDVVYERLLPHDRDALIVATAALDGYGVRIRLEQEPGSGGIAQVVTLTTKLVGHDVQGVRATGDKVTRARPLASIAGAGLLALRRGAWNRWYIDLLARFPVAKHDDPVDATAGALADLTGVGTVQSAPSIYQ